MEHHRIELIRHVAQTLAWLETSPHVWKIVHVCKVVSTKALQDSWEGFIFNEDLIRELSMKDSEDMNRQYSWVQKVCVKQLGTRNKRKNSPEPPVEDTDTK